MASPNVDRGGRGSSPPTHDENSRAGPDRGPHRCLGKPATLGIRPEDLHMANGNDPAELSFEAVVEVAEQLGSEIILDLKAGGGAMVASVEPTVRVKPQQKIRLGINPAGLRFFDAKTEAAI
jgi:multiple sugar transport system ATP-binding protein